MIFKKGNSKSYTDIELGIHIKKCQYYSLCDDEQNIGHFYCTENQSVGSFKDSRVLISVSKKTFANRHYELRNINNNALIGHVTIANNVARKSLKATIDIIHQELYNWEVLESSLGFSLLISKTWSKFFARLFNNTEETIFNWNYRSREVYRYKLEHLPIIGKIEMSNTQNFFLLFAGLFLTEMELQLKAVD